MATQRPKYGELALIEQIRRAAQKLPRSRGVRLGIGDDCAILAPPAGCEVVVTTDFSLEGRHFLRDRHPAESVGHRVLARGLSDLAAMGATPLAAFLSLAVPRVVARDARWMEGFLGGLMALARATGTPLAGGDTSESPVDRVLADIVLLGAVPAGKALRRDGAQVGDGIYVTGKLGGAAVELGRVLAAKRRLRVDAAGEHPHFFPQPRLAQGLALRGRATACVDLSDGLSTDLGHLCVASGVGAEIDLAALPLAVGASVAMALDGGEDYELLFTASAERPMPKRLRGVAVTRVGTVTRAKRVMARGVDGVVASLLPGGWEHLR
jgi:thiamine-monophosphate kinase